MDFKRRMPYTTSDYIIVVHDAINVVTEPLQHINYLCAFEKGNFLHLRKISERNLKESISTEGTECEEGVTPVVTTDNSAVT